MLRAALSTLAICLAVTPLLADKNVTIQPKIASVGSPVLTESFDGELPKTFQSAKGEWKVADGTLVAKELAEDKHAAVLNLQKKNRNSVVRFSFKMDDKTNGMHFSLNHKGGHLFRVIVFPNRLAISLDKDKKDPKSKPQVLANEKGDFEQGKWYTMQVEMLGDQVVVQTDNAIVAEAKHPKLDTNKPNYRFIMRKQTLAIDDIHVWELK